MFSSFPGLALMCLQCVNVLQPRHCNDITYCAENEVRYKHLHKSGKPFFFFFVCLCVTNFDLFYSCRSVAWKLLGQTKTFDLQRTFFCTRLNLISEICILNIAKPFKNFDIRFLNIFSHYAFVQTYM